METSLKKLFHRWLNISAHHNTPDEVVLIHHHTEYMNITYYPRKIYFTKGSQQIIISLTTLQSSVDGCFTDNVIKYCELIEPFLFQLEIAFKRGMVFDERR